MMTNFESMIELAEGTFDARHDTNQLQVDESVISRLMALHPATVRELNEGQGPCIWILIIPTTKLIMNEFILGQIGEQTLLDRSETESRFDAIYLCSAMVLPEYRRKGLALKMTLEAVQSIRSTHPITNLFVWPFTDEGKQLALKISETTGLEIQFRTEKEKRF